MRPSREHGDIMEMQSVAFRGPQALKNDIDLLSEWAMTLVVKSSPTNISWGTWFSDPE